MSKTEVLKVAFSAYIIGLPTSLAIPNAQQICIWVLQEILNIVGGMVTHPVISMISLTISLLTIALLINHYQTEFANFYRIFFIWGPTGILGWLGGIITPIDPARGIFLLIVGIIFGLAFRWAAPPMIKYVL